MKADTLRWGGREVAGATVRQAEACVGQGWELGRKCITLSPPMSVPCWTGSGTRCGSKHRAWQWGVRLVVLRLVEVPGTGKSSQSRQDLNLSNSFSELKD